MPTIVLCTLCADSSSNINWLVYVAQILLICIIIIELVDSTCKDSADTQYTIIQKLLSYKPL